MGENQETVQQAERGCRDDEKVGGDDLAGMVDQKRFPGGRGGFLGRSMYRAAVDSATSWPKRASSAWMRGRPQSGFSRNMRRINSWRVRSKFGRPVLQDRDFQRE